MLSFNNFCSLISSKKNSILPEKYLQLFQDMDQPISDYYIYTDFTETETTKEEVKNDINHFEHSLKRGCRCLRVAIFDSKEGEPIVKLNSLGQNASLEEIVNIINTKAF